MRVIKPFAASLLTRPFEFRRKSYLGVSVLLFSPMGDKPWLLPEKELWPFWATQPEAQAPLEEGFPRRAAEYLVCGSAYTRPERRDAVAVRAQVGAMRKELVVWGDRHWQGQSVSPAEPFTELRLGWQHAWGGPDDPANPLGCGRQELQRPDGRRVRPLPRLELPSRPLVSPQSVGTPAGFGPVDGTWQPRAGWRGTYDQAWLENHFPGLAPDIDWRHFQVAPADQQQPEPFTGQEAYTFDQWHPGRPQVAGRLPGVRSRVFLQRGKASAAPLEEVAMALRALWFFPGDERVVQVFQGVAEVQEDDASDIGLALVAVEKLGQPREVTHYRQVLDKRLDRKRGALEVLRDGDLAPADITAPLHDFKPTPSRGLERAERRAEAERAAARQDVESHGLKADEHAPPVKAPPPPRIETIDDLIAQAEKMEREAAEMPNKMAAEKARTLADARQVAADGQWDFGLIEREMAGELTSGPPKPLAPGLRRDFQGFIEAGQAGGGDIRELQEMLADDAVMRQWDGADAAALQAYRENAQHQYPAARLTDEASAALRQRLQAAHAAGQSMAGWDLTGANLAGLDLAGADLREALMEGVQLQGCNLARAQLQRVVLARARIDSCALDGADLQGANFSLAEVHNCTLRACDLRDAVLEKTHWHKVDASGSRLDRIRLLEVKLDGVDLSQVRSDTMLTLRGLDLSGTRWRGAVLKQAVIVECKLAGVDLSGCRFEKVAFVTVQADGARLRGLAASAACFAMGCSLQDADLREVQLERVCFRGTAMARSALDGAVVRGSDFSECDLRGSRWFGADARDARFVRAQLQGASLAAANLAQAVLQHALLQDTDFRHSNLHQADAARVRVGPGVRWEGALTTRLRTLPRHVPQEGVA